MLNIEEIGGFLDSFDFEKELRKMTGYDWQSWSQLQTTRKFLELLILKRLDIQQQMTVMSLEGEKPLVDISIMKGGHDEIGHLVECLKFLTNEGDLEGEDT